MGSGPAVLGAGGHPSAALGMGTGEKWSLKKHLSLQL